MTEPLRMSIDARRIDEAVARTRPDSRAPDLASPVAETIAAVRARGDDAVVAATRRFDAPDFSSGQIRVPEEVLRRARDELPPDLREAIAVAAQQVRELSLAARPADRSVEMDAGQCVQLRHVPIGAVGCYVPGGRAAYPSSLVMAVVPAQVAGVDRIAVATPAGVDGRPAAVTLGAAALLGVDELYAMGGAAAVAALAYGTETVSPVDIIVGPGNSWVQEAKRQVCGDVGVDSPVAGPSEVVALVDQAADPEAIALDLMAQAEHGDDSPAVAVSVDRGVLDAIAAALAARRATAGRISLLDAPDWDVALAFCERFAPEHLQLNVREPEPLASRIRRAGAVFVGKNGGTAFGDYVAGSNHILPTGGGARFASAVGVATYLRRMSVVDMTQTAVDRLAPHLVALADAEGFPAHRDSARVRAER